MSPAGTSTTTEDAAASGGHACTPSEPATVLSKTGWFTGIWRAASGETFVTDAGGLIHHRPANRGDAWPTHEVPGVVMGVYGIDANHVHAWGLRGDDDSMVRWNGEAWSDMPCPQGGIIAMHGVDPELLFVVGERGMSARWDGTAWTTIDTPVTENLASVFVVSADEVWACGHRGALLRGSSEGWAKVAATAGSAMTSVAHWRGEVYVATLSAGGFVKLDPASGELVSVHKGLVGGELDARENLLLATTGWLVDKSETDDFQGFAVGVFADLVRNHPAPWAG